VCLELLRRDGWLVSTNECDENKGEVRSRRDELHVPMDNEDLDLGTVIIVTWSWWYRQAAVVLLCYCGDEDNVVDSCT
jgi:hypothetical protein